MTGSSSSSNRVAERRRDHHHHHRHHRDRHNSIANGTNFRRDMYDSYQAWALKTYGDSAKTKTVTRKKYNRILKILKGEEHNNAENSKFRFWVKAKGFRVGPPPGHPSEGRRHDQVLLYVPYTQVKSVESTKESSVYKKVAVVENFFDIIYNVHVEMDGRGGKHAGQKRTYKAIAETYAFLPREAVTNFLMQCSDCQKRMHAGGGSEGGSCARVSAALPKQSVTVSAFSGPQSPANSHTSESACSTDPPEIDFSIPITTTYMKHLRNMGFSTEEALNLDNEDCVSNERSDSSLDASSPHPIDEEMSPYSGKKDNDKGGSLVSPVDYDRPLDMSKTESSMMDSGETERSRKASGSHSPASPSWANGSSQPLNMSFNSDGNMHHRSSLRNRHLQSSSSAPASALSPSSPPPSSLSLPDSVSEHHHHHHHRRHHHHSHSHHHHQSSSRNHQDHNYEDVPNGTSHERVVTPEDLTCIVKEEDEEEEDEVDDKLDPQKCDPERLKAFNMFVRLFVDENLDRMVPISKQPKEKIQAIIDSCARQFPEFSERSRKRIRTYLKSCRRTKRCRDQNGWELGRPTPPHLTSAMAEQILAAACDNESNNAKRMRLGLGPVSTLASSDRENGDATSTLRQTAALRAYSDAHKYSVATNGSTGLFRMGSNNNSGNSPNHCPSSQGPADLSIKKSSSPPQPPAKCPLNPSEVSAVRQLIAGYRESAAFLVRSADELEQLLLQQN